MIQDIMDYLSQADPEVGASIQREFDREQHNIELIASENIVSQAVMAAMGTCLTNKYAEGYPGKRYYGGCWAVDVTEELARQRACQLFGCQHANVQPHSGANANLAVIPCVTCSREGRRLGRGGGYYDRFLAHYRGAAVLVCRERLLRQEIPFGVHDYPVPWVVTEAGLFEDGTPARPE